MPKIAYRLKTITLVILFALTTTPLFAQVPTILSFSPSQDSVGATVTISGTNFNSTIANNIVFFGKSRAVVTSSSASSLSVIVPSGFNYDLITVINTSTSLAASSSLPFMKTFSPSKPFLSEKDFDKNQNFTTGTYVSTVKVCDFDNDNKIDIISFNGASSVSVLRNISIGDSIKFAPKVDFVTSTSSAGFDIGDIDGDGKMDIAITNYGLNTVSVLRNISTAGNINFASKVDFATGTSPGKVAISDIDGNGKFDLAITNQSLNNVSILLNTSTIGVINFAPKNDFSSSLANLREINFVDIDGDKKNDLIVETSSNTSVFRNTSTIGNVSFGNLISLSSPNAFFGDIDGDQKLDMVTTNESNSQLIISKNTSTIGSISFATPITYTTSSNSPQKPVFANLNGDAKLDIVVPHWGGNLSIYLNNGVGSSISFTNTLTKYIESSMYQLSITDLNNDGKSDIITTPLGANYVVVNRNKTFKNANLVSLSINNGDLSPSFHRDSLYYTNNIFLTSNGVSLLPILEDTLAKVYMKANTGNYVVVNSGFFSPNFSLNAGLNNIAVKVVSADSTVVKLYSLTINMSGSAPPVISSFYPLSDTTGALITIKGNGFNNNIANNIVFFGKAKANVIYSSGDTLLVTVPVGASLDPVSVLNTSTSLIATSSSLFSPLFNPHKSSITTSDFMPKLDFVTGPTGATYNSIITGDIDLDGKMDLVVVNDLDSTLSIRRNISTGSSLAYASAITIQIGSYPTPPIMKDIDGDGKLDLLVGSTSIGVPLANVLIYRNTSTVGTISFANKISIPIQKSISAIEVADMDNDGKNDLLISSYIYNTAQNFVSIFKNIGSTGTISFAPNIDFEINGGGLLRVYDLNNDNKTDIVIIDNTSEIEILQNTTVNQIFSFTKTGKYTYNRYAVRDIAFGNINNDSKVDIIVISSDYQSNSNMTNYIETFINTSLGFVTFNQTASLITPNLVPRKISISDLDGDGKQDVSISFFSYVTSKSIVKVYRNTSTTSSNINFELKLDLDSANNFINLTSADLDANGTPELILLKSNPNILSIYRNNPIFNNTNLSNLSISGAYLFPVFSKQTLVYTTNVSNLATSVTVKPILEDELSTLQIQINGGSYTSMGNAIESGSLSLNVGLNILNIKVTGLDGVSSKIYTVNITRLPPPPTITSLSPYAGNIGATVNIIGANFNPVAANNLVYFGTIKAVVNSATSSSLNVTVPIGACSGNISVVNTSNSLVGVSGQPFNITYIPNKAVISSFDFDEKKSAPTLSGNNFSTVGDIDGDGKTDIIVANKKDSTISIYRNVSVFDSLAFATKIKLKTTFNPNLYISNYIYVTDLNGDGKYDLVILNKDSNSFSVLKNLSTIGNINFAPEVNYYTSGIPYGLAFGDLDEDGKTDIVLIDGNYTSIFKNVSTIDTICLSLTNEITNGGDHVSIANLDSDKKPEVIVNSGEYFSVLRNVSNNGIINFSNNITKVSVGNSLESSIAADFDGDGKIDLAFSFYNGYTAVIRNNTIDTNISFSAATIVSSFGFGVNDFAAADLNGDGKLDLICENKVYDQFFYLKKGLIYIFKNTSSVGNISFVSEAGLPQNNYYDKICIADMDNNGKPDIITSDNSSQVSIIENIPYGNAKLKAINISTGGMAPVFSPSIFNYFNDQLYTDSIITIRPESLDSTASIKYKLNGGAITNIKSGVISPALNINLGINILTITVKSADSIYTRTYTIKIQRVTKPPFITSFFPAKGNVGTNVTIYGKNFNTIADSNVVYFGATKASVISANDSVLSVTVPIGAKFSAISVLNKSNSLTAYSAKPFLPTFSPNKETITNADFSVKTEIGVSSYDNYTVKTNGSFADFDGDGKADIVILNLYNKIIILRNISTISSYNFAPKFDLDSGVFEALGKLFISDLDGDGKLDIIVNNIIYQNQSTIGNLNFIKINNRLDKKVMGIADFDSDGKPDVILTGGYAKNCSIDKTILFSETRVLPIGLKDEKLVITDINNDNKSDLVITNIDSNLISIFKNISTMGQINFANKVSISTASYYSSNIVVGDMDNDGKQDIAVTKKSMGLVSIYRNIGDSNSIAFTNNLNIGFPLYYNPEEMEIGDLNGDGKLDLLVQVDMVNDKLMVIKNTTDSNQMALTLDLQFTKTSNISLNPLNCFIGDVNGDGKCDVAALNSANLALTISILGNNPVFSTNANLSSLTINKGVLTPSFSVNNLAYSVIVKDSISNIIIGETLADNLASAQIKINNSTFSLINKNNPNTLVSLNQGLNRVEIKVIAQDGVTTKSYIVNIVRTNETTPSALVYSPNNILAVRTQTNINAVPSNVGSKIINYSITPNLPTGLSINDSTGVISGVPSVTIPLTNYTITGSNLLGSTSTTFTLTVNPMAPSSFSYSSPDIVATRTQTLVSSYPINLTETVSSYTITPSLPMGLSFNTTSGSIGGIPTVLLEPTIFTITASNISGNATTNVKITVKAIAPINLKYKDSIIVATRTLTSINAIPSYLRDTITNFSISPNLPSGVSLNGKTGVISGIPNQTIPKTVYNITGENSGGITKAFFTLTVNPIAPTALKYTDSVITAIKNKTLINAVPSNSGDSITNYTITPILPIGLKLDASTGIISGTPVTVQTKTVYVIKGSNFSGYSNASFTLTVNSDVSYNELEDQLFNNFKLKPNPFSEELEIQFTSLTKTEAKLTIIDALGKVAYVNKLDNLIVGENTMVLKDVSNLKGGIYFAYIENEEGKSRPVKIIKN